ncbi:tetratricopeptide repeat protein [Leptospira ryugenii]|uniref:Tetratricopeptide repeat protein n=1 Tax=Leptospira ryugenii TaxID=1917863 RepID=A0A2P2DY63_9LEPT|nr:hypothetical protein [Leptospira ryugenii]GBF49540.1 tetratricopeptide repeat protein [Leptospira ryugenii]
MQQNRDFFSILRKAIRLERDREFTKAFNIFSEAESLSPNPQTKIKIRARMALCQNVLGNTKETELQFQKVMDDFADHPLSLDVYARFLIRIKKFKSAKSILNKGIFTFPHYLEFYLLLASLLKDMDRSEESIAILKQALSREDLSKAKGINRKDIWAELGSLYYARADYNSALVCLRKSLAMGLESDFLHFELLALCYLELEDAESAIRSLESLVEYAGEIDPEILILFARAKCRLGLIEEAAQFLIQAYSYEDSLTLKGHEMNDFAPLLRNGFFTTLENVEWEES